MRLILVESSLEPVPKEIAYHADVIRSRSKLLEDYLHYRAIRKLEKAEKRGRPDIVHRCLLLALDSKLFSEIYVHTIAGRVIRVNPEVRLPRTYDRFKGLMEKLFEKGKIVADDVLLEIVDTSLKKLLVGKTVVLREVAENRSACEEIVKANTVCLGAFPHGDYEKETIEVFKKAKATFVSFGSEKYTSTFALCRVICCLLG